MAMKFYSDVTRKFYDSATACEDAERKEFERQNQEKIQKEQEAAALKAKKEAEAAERKALAAKVEEARKEMVNAQNKYKDVLNEFIKRYKTYHYSTTDLNDIPTLFELVIRIFD